MLRKLLCWLGWHSKEDYNFVYVPNSYCSAEDAYLECKHCGKVKR